MIGILYFILFALTAYAVGYGIIYGATAYVHTPTNELPEFWANYFMISGLIIVLDVLVIVYAIASYFL
jgi:hypothetical protein